MFLLPCKIKYDYSNDYLIKTLLYINLLVNSLANSLHVLIGKIKVCQVNCLNFLHFIIEATCFMDIAKILR